MQWCTVRGVEASSASQFVQCADRWRTHLKLGHSAFLAYVGRTADNGGKQAPTEWFLLRRGKRTPSKSFTRLVLAKARQVDPVWADLLEAAHNRDSLAGVA